MLRERKLVQLTRDDSLVSHLVARGQLTSDEARVFRYRNVLLQALGVQENLAVQIVALTPKVGDRFLLCSDGLNACLEDDAIADLPAPHSEPMICCRKLTERVCALGAPDNVTVALVSVLAGDEGTSPHDTEQATSWERRVIDI